MQQNQTSFCFAEDFDPAVCTFDNGIYCPNRCGVCAVTVAPQAPVLQLPMLIAGDVAQFDRVGFRDKMARSLRISPDQVTVAVTPGSVLAVSTISTTSGSAEELAALEASATATFSSAAAASELLGVQVETVQPVTTVEVEVAEEPRAPPASARPQRPPAAGKGRQRRAPGRAHRGRGAARGRPGRVDVAAGGAGGDGPSDQSEQLVREQRASAETGLCTVHL